MKPEDVPDIMFLPDIPITAPVNVAPLVASGTGAIQTAIANDEVTLFWNFVDVRGNASREKIIPAISGEYTWLNKGHGIYALVMPVIANVGGGTGWFTGMAGGVRPWRGPSIGFPSNGKKEGRIFALDMDDDTYGGFDGSIWGN